MGWKREELQRIRGFYGGLWLAMKTAKKGLGNLCSILLSYRDLGRIQLVSRFAFSLWRSVGTSKASCIDALAQ